MNAQDSAAKSTEGSVTQEFAQAPLRSLYYILASLGIISAAFLYVLPLISPYFLTFLKILYWLVLTGIPVYVAALRIGGNLKPHPFAFIIMLQLFVAICISDSIKPLIRPIPITDFPLWIQTADPYVRAFGTFILTIAIVVEMYYLYCLATNSFPRFGPFRKLNEKAPLP